MNKPTRNAMLCLLGFFIFFVGVGLGQRDGREFVLRKLLSQGAIELVNQGKPVELKNVTWEECE